MTTRLYCAVTTRALILSESLRRLTLRALCAWLAFISPMAMADGDIAGMLDSVSTGATSGTKSILNIAFFVGVLGVFCSLLAAKDMKNNPHVKTWMVVLGFVISILLIVIPQLISRGLVQINMTPVSVG